MAIPMKLDVTVNLPMLPNFIRWGSGSAVTSCDVADLTDDQLTALGAAWTEALLKHAQKRRAR